MGAFPVTAQHSVSVAGVVIDDRERVLVIQRRDNGRWEPPGGVLELGESFEDGVRREIREETGVDVSVERITGVYKNMKRGIVALVFRCHPRGTPAPETDEARDVRWMSLAEVRATFTPAYAVRVEDAFAQTVAVRVHDGTSVL